MAGMFDYTPGLLALGGGLDSIGDAFKGYMANRQQAALGDQIQSGDLLGAAKTAIAGGDLSTGLKLYELHRKTGDEAGLGERLNNIIGVTATPALQAGRSAAVVPTAAASLPASFASAVAGGETSATDPGAYGTLGMVIPKTGDQAYGKYQVMGTNIRPWTKEILGQEMSPQEFLASPEAQEAVFKGKFGQYASKYGPEGAARAWFAGEGRMNNPNAVDPLGTTVSSYAAGFNRRLGQPPAMQAISTATGGTTPDGTPIDLAASAAEPRRLGPAPTAKPLGQPPPEKDDDPQIADLISKRNQLIGMMPETRGTKYETMVPAAIKSFEEQITYLRNKKDKGEDVQSQTGARMRLAPSLGLQPGTKEWQQYIATGNPGADKAQTEAQVRDQRAADAERYGLQKGSDTYQHYVLTGNLPPAQGDQMKAFEANALQKANDKAFAASQSIAQMEQALKLNEKALSGNFQPGIESFVYRNLPIGVSKHLADPERVIATTEFNNLAQSANLSLGKEMFGARVTNYDEQLLQQLRASVDKSPDERRAILLRLIDNRKAIAAQAANEVNQIRSGEFFKRTKPGDVPDSVIHDNNTKAPPPGFTKAADGEYYKPDPAYPGKFLKWTP
jgi:hypothetical protein